MDELPRASSTYRLECWARIGLNASVMNSAFGTSPAIGGGVIFTRWLATPPCAAVETREEPLRNSLERAGRLLAIPPIHMARAQAATIIIRPAGAGWLRIGEHLRRLAEYSDLLRTLNAHRINVRYRQTVLGATWAVLQPLLMMTIFVTVF